MSFEDDEYWEDEYSVNARPVSYLDNAAVDPDRYADDPPPVIPTRALGIDDPP